MAYDDVYLRLVCGDEELDLHDVSLTYLSEGGFSPEGPGTDITWRRQGRRRAQTRHARSHHGLNISLKTATDMGRYAQVMRELKRFETYAQRYEEKRQNEPVYLRYRWHSAGPLPLLGLGALQKRVYRLAAQWPADLHTEGYFQTPTVLKMPVALECAASWIDTVDQPLGIATGGLVEHRQTAGPWTDDLGLQIATGTTNEVNNPSFENDVTTDWGLVNGSRARDTSRSYMGAASCRLTAGSGANATMPNTTTLNLANGNTVAASVYIYREDAVGCQVKIRDTTTPADRATVAPSLTGQWERVTATWTNTTGGAVNVQIQVVNTEQDGSSPIWFDAAQIEDNTYVTPYCDGSLGPGHSWASTVHDSDSTRVATVLHYDAHVTSLIQVHGSLCGWWIVDTVPSERPSGFACLFDARGANDTHRIMLRCDQADDLFDLYIDGNYRITNVGSGSISRGDAIFWCATWDFATHSYTLTVYQDGTAYSDSATTALAFPTLTVFTIGVLYDKGNNWVNGCLDDVRIFDEVLDANEIQQIYDSTAETKSAEKLIGVIPYLWTSSGGGQVDNRDDGTGECLGVIGTPRGDEPAALRLFVLGEAVNTVLNARIALRHRGFPHWYPLLEQGDGDAGTGSNVADAGANDGNKWLDGGAGLLSRAWYLDLLEGGEQAFYGRFRVYGRFEVSVNTAEWDAYVRITCEPTVYSPFVTDTIELSDAVLTNWFLADFGEVSLPQIEYPEALSDVEQLQVYVRADRTDGTGSRLYLDYLLLLPVDDEGHIITEDEEAPIDGANVELILDTINAPPIHIKANTSHQVIARPLWSGKPLYPTTRGPSRLVITGSKQEDTVGWEDWIETTMYLSGYIRSRYTMAPDA